MTMKMLMRTFLWLLLAVNVCAEEPLRTALKPEHVEALAGAEKGMKRAATVHAESAQTDHVKVGREVLALLEMPRAKMAGPLKLVGKWRVRSLQISDRGAYAYPFFDCSFRQEGASGVIFQKDSGSQRRIGIVGADAADRLLFVGGSYYADEKGGAGYSALQEESVKIDPERDSVGAIYQLGPGHLIILFAPNRFGREIYELKK